MFQKGGQQGFHQKNQFYCSIRFTNNLKRKFIGVYFYGFFHFLEHFFFWKPLPSSFFPTKRLFPQDIIRGLLKGFPCQVHGGERKKKGFLSRHLVSPFLFLFRDLFSHNFLHLASALKRKRSAQPCLQFRPLSGFFFAKSRSDGSKKRGREKGEIRGSRHEMTRISASAKWGGCVTDWDSPFFYLLKK